MKVERFTEILGSEFYTGVPDSLLRPLCDHLIGKYGTDPRRHVIAANEGNCAALTAGYHLATGKAAVVYMQNSGEGNAVNPIASLLDDRVYGIPAIFVIGWRGEPGVRDEPQHAFQGEITLKTLELLEIPYSVIDKSTVERELEEKMNDFRKLLAKGRCVAFVIKKGALEGETKLAYKNGYTLSREEAVRLISRAAEGDPVVSTTGKASRELFELRERYGEGHSNDFLTVGSMGHCSSVALGVALNKPHVKVWCIDGDGAALMHLGAFAVNGSTSPGNLVHVLINNEAHETVGGMPDVSKNVDYPALAKACGYPETRSVSDPEGLVRALGEARKSERLFFIEVKCAIGARKDLGRPTTTAKENKEAFRKRLAEL